MASTLALARHSLGSHCADPGLRSLYVGQDLSRLSFNDPPSPLARALVPQETELPDCPSPGARAQPKRVYVGTLPTCPHEFCTYACIPFLFFKEQYLGLFYEL